MYHNLDNLDPFTKNLVNSVHVLESKLYSSLPNKIIELLPNIISTGYVSGAVKHALYMQKNAHLLGDKYTYKFLGRISIDKELIKNKYQSDSSTGANILSAFVTFRSKEIAGIKKNWTLNLNI